MSRVTWLAIIGALLTGFTSYLLAFSAMRSGNETGAGLLMLAAGVTFGLVVMAVLLSISLSASRTRG